MNHTFKANKQHQTKAEINAEIQQIFQLNWTETEDSFPGT